MIKRPQLLETIRSSLRRSRVVALVGPRQCGKTMLAHYHGNVWNAAEPARSLGVTLTPVIETNGLFGTTQPLP